MSSTFICNECRGPAQIRFDDGKGNPICAACAADASMKGEQQKPELLKDNKEFFRG